MNSVEPAAQLAPPERPNPFARPVIDGPRDALATAPSIHKAELQRILAAFEQLAQQPAPRLKRGSLATLVLSQMPGSGKSHLLGRLWRELNGRALVVFLRGHQDEHAFWRRILERLVQELEYPEATDQRVLQPGTATQLDSLARHLLADLMQRALDQKLLNIQPQTVQMVRDGRAEVMSLLKRNLSGLMAWLGKLVPIWINQLAKAGLHLERDAVAWLKVLTCYTVYQPNETQRGLALAWLQGNELEVQEAALLGLGASQRRPQASGSEGESSLNESAFKCVKDLCALSAFFRPVVFAFDQTEIYGQSPALAHAFGATIGRLQAECINQFTVVTSNEHPWLTCIHKHFELADQDRFDPQLRVVIKGIQQEQAHELVSIKLQSAGYPEAFIADFLARPWMSELYASRVVRPLPRDIEKAASRALGALIHGEPSPDKTDTSSPPEADTALEVDATLRQSFENHRTRLLNTPKALDFDVGVLSWTLGTGLSRVPGLRVEEGFRSAKQKLQGCWRSGTHTTFFILDDSTHWKRWLSIVADYHHHTQSEQRKGQHVRGMVLWHRSLKPATEGMRKQLDSPTATGLLLHDLSDTDMAQLYAAQALYTEICQGDLPGITLPALLDFLGQHLQPWAHALLGISAARTAEVPAHAATPTTAQSKPSEETTPRLPPSASTAADRTASRTSSHNRDLYLTVTELVCACHRPGWLAAWQMGQSPSVLPRGGDGRSSSGARLHLVAQAFAEWATAESSLDLAFALADEQALHTQLLALGGQRLLMRLARLNQPEQVSRAQLHLEQLARYFWQARQGCTHFTSWRDVFLVQEHPLHRVPLATHEGRTVWVSGRLDSLRHALPHSALLVDYKFTSADAPQEGLLQLAIYQRMLHQQHQLRVDAELVFMTPPTSTIKRDAVALEQLFDSQVQPVLNRLLGLVVPPHADFVLPAGTAVTTPTAVATQPVQPAPATAPQPLCSASSVMLGHKRYHPHPDVAIPLLDLARHSAVLGSSGSGKTTAALHLIEQVLEQGVPAILLDRKGDLCRYAQPDAWTDPAWPPVAFMDQQRRAALHQRLAISVYTPGAIQGRSLRLPLAPNGLDQLPEDERDEIARDAAAAFAAALNLTKTSDQPKLAVLVRVFQILARRISGRGIGLDDVLGLLANSDPDLEAAIGVLDPRLCRRLAEQVETFRINSGKLLDERAEALNWTQWLTPRADGRIPLTIVSTKFLGDDSSALFWVAQFFLELLRHVSRHPSDRLQGLLMIDEADIYMPATKSPATKAPLAGLLRRARSAGVGLMLCTQSPGDLDYKGRDNIRNWLIGLVQQNTALKKLEGVLSDSRVQPEHISKQKVGQFIFAAEGRGDPISVPPNLVKTQQLSEPEILQVARQCRQG